MTLIRYIEWILSILAGFAAVSFISSFLEKIRNKWLKLLIFFIRLLAMTGLGFLMIASESHITWTHAYPLMGIYIALFAECACDVITAVLHFLKKEQKKRSRMILTGIIVLLYAAYGTVNSQIIYEDHLSFSSGKLREKHTFVFFSDLHYGSSQTSRSFENALKRISAEKPEFVLLGGDICDEHTEKEEMQRVFEQLGSLEMPVYYIYGNHDRQGHGHLIGGKKYSEEEFEQAILNSGIIILQDDFVQFGDEIVLLGREDVSSPSRKAVKDLPARPESAYVINTDHCPYQNEDILETGADLQLSGHTHAGQIFPMRFLYTLAGLNVVNTYQIGSTALYVSPGIGNWYYPFRNEAHCSWTLIDLIPE